jgi:outer membrane protein assembly factor BamB
MRHIIIISIILLCSMNTTSQIILEWRGINRTGFFPTNNLLTEWPEKEGPELILHVEDLPEAYSSVIVKDEIMYTTGIEDTLEMLTAIDLKGTILWKTVYGNAWGKSFRNARCTPTVEGNYAYVISGAGDMACIDIRNGDLIWTRDAFTEFEGVCGLWGIAESPLIIDDLMIYSPCGEKTTVIALNKLSGETVWMSKSINDQSAYCSPIVIEKDQIKLIVNVTGNYVIGVNSADGEIFWKYHYTGVEEFKNGHDINPITPLVKGNEIFVTSGYNHTGLMLIMSEDMRSVELKWKSEDMDSHHGGVVEHNGYIYGSNFSTIVSGDWACIDWNTGELKYEYDWFTKGQIIKTEDYLICYDERKGNIALVEPTPEKFKIISSFKVKGGNGPHWSHPTIYDDKLILRHGKSLLVYNISKK